MSADATPTAAPTEESPLKKNAVVIGSVVGVVAFVAVGGAALLLARRRRRRSASPYRRDLHGLPKTGSDGVAIEKANPVRQPWRRFDMLEDEETLWTGRKPGSGGGDDDDDGFDDIAVGVRTPRQRDYDLGHMHSRGPREMSQRRDGSLVGEAKRVVSDSASYISASLGIGGAALATRYDNLPRGEDDRLTSPLKSSTRYLNPLSPTTSLYGSTFSPLPGGTPAEYNPLRRSGTWWKRFTANAGLARSSPSQAPIRDPMPAPGSVDDPFADPSLPGSTETTPKRSLHRRDEAEDEFEYEAASDDEGDGLLHARMGQDGSMGSLASATSSILEERVRTMDVMRRERPSDGSTTNVSPTTDDGAGPFADRGPAAAAATPGGDVIWRGSDAFSPATTAFMSPSSIYAPTPLMPGSSGVRRMVAEYERRRPEPVPEVPAIPSPLLHEAAVMMSPRTKARVNHGLVKKPQLFVANPS
jgi:hypothetical protein